MRTSQTLLEKVKAQDAAAWERFFKIYWPFVLAAARAEGLADADAQDAAQQTMIQAWKGLEAGQFNPRVGRFRDWMIRILRCRVADRWRSLARQHTTDLPEAQTGTAPLERIADASEAQPDAQMDMEWERNILRVARERVWKKLSQRDVQIYEQLEKRGGDSRQTAQDLGITAARVYVAKYRVQKGLKKEVARLEKGAY